MAGDFIKVEKATARKPEVLRIAMLLKIHPDHALGLCIRFWSWCDDNMSDGTAAIDCQILDAVLGTSGFALALIEVGWLKDRKNALEIPNFDRHMSQSAKVRCSATERKRKSRTAKDVTHLSQKSVTHVTEKCDYREEKRREEKNEEETSHTARETPFLTAGPSKAFLKFYETYPRPLKKRDAWDQWQITVVTLASERGQNDATVEQWLIDRAEAFGASPAGLSPPPGDQDFRPAPDAWLKAGRYDDPPSEWMRPNRKSTNGTGTNTHQRGGNESARTQSLRSGVDLDRLFDEIEPTERVETPSDGTIPRPDGGFG